MAQAQTSASGRAYGTSLDLGGTPLLDPPASDTGTQTAPPGESFDKSVSGAQIPGAPLIEGVTGASRTRGCVNADGCTGAPLPGQFVLSEAGNATVSLLLDQPTPGTNVLDVSSSGSSAQVSCASGQLATSGSGHIDVLVIGGNPVTIPPDQPPNTQIVSSQLPLLVLNEQACPDPAAPAGTTTCTVNALHAQVLPAVTAPGAQLLDIKLSHSTASLTDSACPGGDNCNPNLTNSAKTSQILQADRTTPKAEQIPAVGDPIRFTVSAVNSAVPSTACPAGSQTGHNLRVIDRIPLGITVDPTSITIQTNDDPPVPTTGTIAPCAANLQFVGCAGEPASDTSRQCLTVADSDLAPGETKRISFIGVVNSNASGGTNVGCDSSGRGAGICNTALIQVDEIENPSGTPRTSAIQCPIPAGVGIGGDLLRTTGSGGCSIGGGRSAGLGETLPVWLVGAWLMLRRVRRRASAS